MTEVDSALLSAGEKAVRRLAELWALTDNELFRLITPIVADRGPASQYIATGGSDADIKALRISCLLGIHRALTELFSDKAQANGWIRRPNSARPLSGTTALEYMSAGGLSSMIEVRRLLEAQLV